MGRKSQATPRKDEFNLISIDIFLRYKEHKFLFANPHNLESSSADVNHLQQNYIMGFVFNDNELYLSDEWSENFDAIKEEDMQIDKRSIVYEGEEYGTTNIIWEYIRQPSKKI